MSAMLALVKPCSVKTSRAASSRARWVWAVRPHCHEPPSAPLAGGLAICLSLTIRPSVCWPSLASGCVPPTADSRNDSRTRFYAAPRSSPVVHRSVPQPGVGQVRLLVGEADGGILVELHPEPGSISGVQRAADEGERVAEHRTRRGARRHVLLDPEVMDSEAE